MWFIFIFESTDSSKELLSSYCIHKIYVVLANLIILMYILKLLFAIVQLAFYAVVSFEINSKASFK